MRIFEVTTEMNSNGLRWTSYRVTARTCEEAVRKVKNKLVSTTERVLEVQMVAATDAFTAAMRRFSGFPVRRKSTRREKKHATE